jgi:hypothetical protein
MPRRTIYFAKLTSGAQVTLADRGSFHDTILEALDPQHKVERYGRTWRFSRPIDQVEFVLGKLGFTHEGEQEQTDYDEEAEDFVTALAPARQTFFSHFVVDIVAEVVAFEDRGRLIRRQSFLGAFDGLLEAAGLNVTVEPLTDPASLREWAASVERVVRIRASVRNPNPGWVDDAGAVRQLVEETDAESVDVTAKASQDHGLNVGAQWVDGALHQISEEGQGTMSAIGVRGEKESRWTSGQRVRSEELEESPQDASETIWSRIVDMLRGVYDRG